MRKNQVLTLLVVISAGIGFAAAQAVADEPAAGSGRLGDQQDRGALRDEVREGVRLALLGALIQNREPIREARQEARETRRDERQEARSDRD